MTDRPTVLVVDDCGDTTEAVAALLEHDGFAVTVCSGGREALARIRSGLQPCMLLVDVRMPDMDGWDFVAACRHDDALGRTPIVMVSGDVTAEERARELGVTAFLPKPLDPDRLTGVVERHCARP